MRTEYHCLSTSLSPTGTSYAKLKYLHSGQESSMGISWLSFLPNWQVALQQVYSKAIKNAQVDKACLVWLQAFYMNDMSRQILASRLYLGFWGVRTTYMHTKAFTWEGEYSGKTTLTRSLCKIYLTLQCKVYFLLLRYFTNVLFIWVDAISICLGWCEFLTHISWTTHSAASRTENLVC